MGRKAIESRTSHHNMMSSCISMYQYVGPLKDSLPVISRKLLLLLLHQCNCCCCCCSCSQEQNNRKLKTSQAEQSSLQTRRQGFFFLVPFLIDPNLTRSHTFFLNKLALFFILNEQTCLLLELDSTLIDMREGTFHPHVLFGSDFAS